MIILRFEKTTPSHHKSTLIFFDFGVREVFKKKKKREEEEEEEEGRKEEQVISLLVLN